MRYTQNLLYHQGLLSRAKDFARAESLSGEGHSLPTSPSSLPLLPKEGGIHPVNQVVKTSRKQVGNGAVREGRAGQRGEALPLRAHWGGSQAHYDREI